MQVQCGGLETVDQPHVIAQACCSAVHMPGWLCRQGMHHAVYSGKLDTCHSNALDTVQAVVRCTVSSQPVRLLLPTNNMGVCLAGDDSNLSSAIVAAFYDSLSSKLKALDQSVHQLKDANRYVVLSGKEGSHLEYWPCVTADKCNDRQDAPYMVLHSTVTC